MRNKINDIRNSVENNCCLSGLALALTIPDIYESSNIQIYCTHRHRYFES